MNEMNRQLVNPVAVSGCRVKFGGVEAPLLDISYVRVVLQDTPELANIAEGEAGIAEFHLDRVHFSASVVCKARGEGWLRFAFENLVPSARAYLRSFLSPKKVGESLYADWQESRKRHYHGLNESELWFDPAGPVLFTYLDQTDFDAQFLIRMSEARGPLRVGKILRRSYIELTNLDQELPLIPLGDREIYAKLGECRDIVTNFRPVEPEEYQLKQRLLKVISETLYSTSHRVEMGLNRPIRSGLSPDA